MISLSTYETVNLLFDLVQHRTMPTADQQKVKEHFIETVTQLCRNVFRFESELTVEGLIGVTLDHRDIILVNINETLTPPADNTDLDDTHFQDVSNPEALTTDVEECFAHASGNSATPLRQKRCRKRQTDANATTEQAHTPSLHVAKLKRRSSELGHSCKQSDNLEADVLRSLTSVLGSVECGQSSASHDHYEIQRSVKLENTEPVADVYSNNTLSPSEQDDGVNINGLLSNGTSLPDVDDQLTSGGQHVTDPDDHDSVADDSVQLVISSVFSLKEQNSGFTADSVATGESQDHTDHEEYYYADHEAVDHSSPLQVIL